MVAVAISEVDVTVESGFDATKLLHYPSMKLGETIIQGRVCYVNSSNKILKSRADAESTAPAKVITIGKGILDAQVAVALPGMLVALGAGTLTKGEPYFVDDTTAGDIVLYSDLAGGAQISFVGIAVSTSVLHFLPGWEGKTV